MLAKPGRLHLPRNVTSSSSVKKPRCSPFGRTTGLSPAVAAASYDDTMPILSADGHFNPRALDVLATSFVDTQALPEKPDMSKLLTEAYLPK